MAKKSKTDKKLKAGAHPQVLRGAAIGARQESFTHAWDEGAEMIGVQLGKALGLKRIGVGIMRIPAGKSAAPMLARHREEEWVYVLMGQGLARIGDNEIEVGAGDFLAFPAPQTAHALRNVGADDLVCLMGGERAKMDVVDYPDANKRTVRVGENVTVYDLAAGQAPAPAVAEQAPAAEKKSQKKSKKR